VRKRKATPQQKQEKRGRGQQRKSDVKKSLLKNFFGREEPFYEQGEGGGAFWVLPQLQRGKVQNRRNHDSGKKKEEDAISRGTRRGGVGESFFREKSGKFLGYSRGTIMRERKKSYRRTLGTWGKGPEVNSTKKKGKVVRKKKDWTGNEGGREELSGLSLPHTVVTFFGRSL